MGTIVTSERYLGRLIWNHENEGINRGGTKVREARPDSEWVVVEKPELRIVDDDLWQRANARFRTKLRFSRKRGSGAKPKVPALPLATATTDAAASEAR